MQKETEWIFEKSSENWNNFHTWINDIRQAV